MSPEQCRGAGNVDQRSDIYSLGCVMFHLLAGRPPFIADGVGELIACHLREPAPRLASFVPGLPPAFDDLVARCLSKSPAERPVNGTALATELSALQGLASGVAAAPSLLAPISMPSGTPWSLQHAETTLPTDQTVPPRIPVTPAHTSVPPTSRRGIVVGALAVLGLAGGALDTSFGTNGIVTLDWFGVTPNVITTTDAALDSHGRLVVVGRASDTGAVHLIVGRLDTTGAFDATFATGGKFTDNAAIVQNTSDVIAIDPSNDQIYFSRNTNETGAITRLKANGDVDTSFAPATTDGQNPTEIAEQMIVQGTSLLVWRIVGSGGSVLTRLLSTGNNDATFNGKILGLPTNTVNVVSFITQNADGTLTTAGYGNNNDSLNFSYVHQMDANGNADASFGVGGTETFSYCGSSSFASTVVPQPSGPPLLIAGFTSTTVILSL